MNINENHIERRFQSTAELRLLEDERPRIRGHAAVFNEMTDVAGLFRERIHPGAFAKTIQEADVRALRGDLGDHL